MSPSIVMLLALLAPLGLSEGAPRPPPGSAPSGVEARASPSEVGAGTAQAPTPAPDPRAQALEAARRRAGSDREGARAAIEALVHGDTPGDAVDWEARLWLASDQERFRGDADGALAWTAPLWAAVLSDGVPGEGRAQRRLETRAAEVHSRVLAALGRTVASREVEAALKRRDRARTGSPEPSAEPGPRWTPLDRAAQARTRRVREQLGVAAWAGVLVFAAVAGPLAVRGGRRRRGARPVGALLVVAFALTAGAFGRLWEPGAGAAAWTMALGFAGVHVLTAFALLGAKEGAARWAVRVLAAWATAAAAFLAMQHAGTLAWVSL